MHGLVLRAGGRVDERVSENPGCGRRAPTVLQVSTADFGGGAESSALQLHLWYRRHGLDAWLAVGRRASDHPGVVEIPGDRARSWLTRSARGLRRRLHDRGLRALGTWIGKVGWLGEPRRFLDARVLGREDHGFPGTWRILSLPPRRPSVLHCHNLHGLETGYFDLRALPTLSRSVPTILNLRDEWLLTGHCAYTLDCVRWRTGCGSCPHLGTYPAIRRDTTRWSWRLRRRAYEASRLYVTAPSTWLLDRVERSMLQPVLSRLIPNAVETEVFTPGDRREARRRLGLSTAGPLVALTAHSEFKGLHNARQVFSRLHLAEPQLTNVQAVCAGRSGPPEQIGRVRLGFRGLVSDRREMADLYRAANVYLHVADAEAFGKTVAEAMACATPVVAAAVGGVPEIISDGVTGLLAQPGAHAALASAMARVLVDEELQHRLGSAAARHAHAAFTLDQQALTFIDFYEEVMEDWHRNRGNPGTA